MSGLLCCSRLGYITKPGIGLVKSKIKNGKPPHPDDRDVCALFELSGSTGVSVGVSVYLCGAELDLGEKAPFSSAFCKSSEFPNSIKSQNHVIWLITARDYFIIDASDQEGIDKPNIRILARRGGFKRIPGIIYEETPKSYVGHDVIVSYILKRKNKSYRGFLENNREMIMSSIFSGEGHDLERYWTFNFLREAETILNKSDYTRLRTKENYWVLILVPTPGVLNSGAQTLLLVEKERQGEGLKAYWEKLIKDYNVHNVDYYYESNEELAYIIRKLIRKNEVLQEGISELRNENLILNNRIDNLERIICREKYNYPVYSASEEFIGETKLDYEFIHDWYGKDIKIRPCPDELLIPWWYK
ncbi:hypothetical protein RhiirA4_461087 [Rhizophagus irregularis]|uniref:Uncharacterized protein n=1 Tax=Rhizophagus irregularis TaxID=588596 RepID=A0A2I1GI28_9GLOM|nr:hypothetical protein RhiirA4_461087 [Rhizophagus irregularis]